jgi:ubiquitin-activating enzyme E1
MKIHDFMKLDNTQISQIAFETLSIYLNQNKTLPRPWNLEDANKFVSIATPRTL